MGFINTDCALKYPRDLKRCRFAIIQSLLFRSSLITSTEWEEVRHSARRRPLPDAAPQQNGVHVPQQINAPPSGRGGLRGRPGAGHAPFRPTTVPPGRTQAFSNRNLQADRGRPFARYSRPNVISNPGNIPRSLERVPQSNNSTGGSLAKAARERGEHPTGMIPNLKQHGAYQCGLGAFEFPASWKAMSEA